MNSPVYQSKSRNGIVNQNIDPIKFSSSIDHDGLDGKDETLLSLVNHTSSATKLQKNNEVLDDPNGLSDNCPQLIVKIDLSRLPFRKNDLKSDQSTEYVSCTMGDVENNVYYTSQTEEKHTTSELGKIHKLDSQRKDNISHLTGPHDQTRSIILQRLDESGSSCDYFDATIKSNLDTSLESKAISSHRVKNDLGDWKSRQWQGAVCDYSDIDETPEKQISKLSLTNAEHAQLYFSDLSLDTHHGPVTDVTHDVYHPRSSNKYEEHLTHVSEPQMKTCSGTVPPVLNNSLFDTEEPQTYFSSVATDTEISKMVGDKPQNSHISGIQDIMGYQHGRSRASSEKFHPHSVLIDKQYTSSGTDFDNEKTYLDNIYTHARTKTGSLEIHKCSTENQTYFHKAEPTTRTGETYSEFLPSTPHYKSAQEKSAPESVGIKSNHCLIADEIEPYFPEFPVSCIRDDGMLSYYQPPWVTCANTPEVSRRLAAEEIVTSDRPDQPVEIGSLVIEYLRPPVTGRVFLRPNLSANENTA